jgi:hypothetical protein
LPLLGVVRSWCTHAAPVRRRAGEHEEQQDRGKGRDERRRARTRDCTTQVHYILHTDPKGTVAKVFQAAGVALPLMIRPS